MPGPFTAEEKARITRLLLDTGFRLFTTQGLRKTSLDDLVRPAGIAKSSFYLFFDSKEALYLELMIGQAAEVKRRVVDQALLRGTDTRDSLRRFLRATVDELATNPLYSRLMTHSEEMEAVTRRLDADRMARLAHNADNPVTALADFVGQRHAEGALIDADPSVVVGVLRAVLLLPLHVEQLGADLYPRILDLLIDIVAAGLTSGKEDVT
ncbi:MAG: TetR family transcriptional regulator [Streptosporangiales bacterium]|nr:TetR family transcriptional regulator [Streptosporangiales bacterium]